MIENVLRDKDNLGKTRIPGKNRIGIISECGCECIFMIIRINGGRNFSWNVFKIFSSERTATIVPCVELNVDLQHRIMIVM